MKKILIIIPFLSVFLFFSSSFSVKANNVTSFPAFPLPVEGKSSTHYIIIFRPQYNQYKLIKPLDPNNIFITRGTDSDTLHYGGPAMLYEWEDGKTTWEYYNTAKDGTINTLYPESQQVVYSSFSLLYEDGTIFFKRAPIKATFLTQTKAVEMGAVMGTVAKMIPMVMIAVAGFLGFRKALRLLLKVLHQA